jgi:hypothetical protein
MWGVMNNNNIYNNKEEEVKNHYKIINNNNNVDEEKLPYGIHYKGNLLIGFKGSQDYIQTLFLLHSLGRYLIGNKNNVIYYIKKELLKKYLLEIIQVPQIKEIKIFTEENDDYFEPEYTYDGGLQFPFYLTVDGIFFKKELNIEQQKLLYEYFNNNCVTGSYILIIMFENIFYWRSPLYGRKESF